MSNSSSPSPISKNSPAAEITQGQLLATTWTLFGIVCLFVIARATVRLRAFGRFFLDDGIVAAAFAVLLANGIVTTLMTPAMYNLLEVSVGHVRPEADFLARSSFYLKMQFTSTVLFWSCIWLVKASFLAFFWRLTDNLQYYRYVWWAIALFTGLAYIGCIITYPVSCPSFTLGECETPYNFRLELISINYSTAVDCLSDFFIMALPCALALRVKLPLRQRFALAGVFGLGFVVITFTIIRVVASAAGDARPEITWLALWSSIQSSVSMVIACLVSFRVLFVQNNRGTGASGYTGSGSRSRQNRTVATARRSTSYFKSPTVSAAAAYEGVNDKQYSNVVSSQQEHELQPTARDAKPGMVARQPSGFESMHEFLLDVEVGATPLNARPSHG